MKKNSFSVSVPINLSIKLGSVFVNGPRETYFVDALTYFITIMVMGGSPGDVSEEPLP